MKRPSYYSNIPIYSLAVLLLAFFLCGIWGYLTAPSAMTPTPIVEQPATHTPSSTPSQTAVGVPSSSPTAVTPTPENSPTASRTPVSTRTPVPTATDTPTAVPATPTPTFEPPPTLCPVLHQVERGDHLWSIAVHHYGNGRRNLDLCQTNRTVIGEDCNLIFAGQILMLPEVCSEAAP